MAWKTKAAVGTMHNETCKMAFGKPSAHSNCPRCEELKNGAKARTWASAHRQYNGDGLSAYCFSVPIYHSRCTAETNPSCNCGKMSYTD